MISNSSIDEIYEAGISAGALGGKMLGAGSGGFMLFFVPPDKQGSLAAPFEKSFVRSIRFLRSRQ